MELIRENRDELETLLRDRSVGAVTAIRARMVLWRDEGYDVADITWMAHVSKRNAHTWLSRYAWCGIGGLWNLPKGKQKQISTSVAVAYCGAFQAKPADQDGIVEVLSRAGVKPCKARKSALR